MTQDLISKKIQTPEEIIISAVNDYGRKSFYGLLSGGKDSMAVTYFVAENYPELFKGVVYCDTTIGLEETKEFVIQECANRGWKLHILLPPRMTYEQWVSLYGFPSKGIHTVVMRRLKYEAMRKFALARLDEKPCLVSGVRRKESIRRLGNVKYPVNHDGNLWFCSPFIDKSTPEVYAYLTENKLKKSPAYNNLHISGDCLCGSFATKGEVMLLRMFYPETYEYIKSIELKIKNNRDIKSEFKTWGNGAGAKAVEDQTNLESFICGECAIY